MRLNFLQDEIMNRFHKEINQRLENIIYYALKRKGFEFKNKCELMSFIKERCRCEYSPTLEARRYYVDDTPFLLWDNFSNKIPFLDVNDREYSFNAKIGRFEYL